MLKQSGVDAYAQLNRNIRAHTFRMPSKQDTLQFRDGGLFPLLQPRFRIDRGAKIFTVGSCFARNIEQVLLNEGFQVPVRGFTLPQGEFVYAASHLLNEYNAGTIIQRLENAAGLFNYTDAMGVEETPAGALDLFLHIETGPVPMPRLRERREEIRTLYGELLSSDALILTLGLVESWYDKAHGCYLNKAPSRTFVRAQPDRFEFHRMDLDDVTSRLRRGIELLIDLGVPRILLTVSPVPVEATFTDVHVMIANSYSKAVLRAAAEDLYRRFPQVDYFPSFEMVSSYGHAGFADDNIHVRPDVVHEVTRHMVTHYTPAELTPSEQNGKSASELYQSFWDTLLSTGAREKALPYAQQLLQAHPALWYGHDLMGHYHSRGGDHAEALTCALRALEMESEQSPDLLNRLARVYEDLDQIDLAIARYEEAAAKPGGEAARKRLNTLRVSLMEQAHLPAAQ